MKTKKPRSDVSPCIAARRGAIALSGLRTAERSSGRDSQGAESKRGLAGCQPPHHPSDERMIPHGVNGGIAESPVSCCESLSRPPTNACGANCQVSHARRPAAPSALRGKPDFHGADIADATHRAWRGSLEVAYNPLRPGVRPAVPVAVGRLTRAHRTVARCGVALCHPGVKQRSHRVRQGLACGRSRQDYHVPRSLRRSAQHGERRRCGCGLA